MNINDLKLSALATAVGTTGQTDDLELTWLQSLGATSVTVQDAWTERLVSLGYTAGALGDMQYQYFGDLGYTGSLQERWFQFWGGDIGGGGPIGGDVPFSVDLWDGAAGNKPIVNGLDLATDGGLVWFKNRTGATNNYLHDTETGSSNPDTYLFSDTTSPAGSGINSLVSYNTDGYTIGGGWSSASHVSWVFKKQAGFFDVIKYTGNSTANRQIPHSLGVQAGFVIIKSLGTSQNWACLQYEMNPNNFLVLNNTNAQGTYFGVWNGTSPTDTAVTIGTDAAVNQNGVEYVMYVFAHNPTGGIYCGQYTGTGTGGNKITLGWEPQYLMVKNVDGAADWNVYDSTRGVEPTDNRLIPNSTAPEAEVGVNVSFDSDGFTMAGNTLYQNRTGNNYIFMAIRA